MEMKVGWGEILHQLRGDIGTKASVHCHREHGKKADDGAHARSQARVTAWTGCDPGLDGQPFSTHERMKSSKGSEQEAKSWESY